MIYTVAASDDHRVIAKKNLEPQMKAISGGEEEEGKKKKEGEKKRQKTGGLKK